MKTTLYAVLFVSLVLLSIAHATTLNPMIDASLAHYEPLPAKPGDKIDLYIQVENTGDSAAKNVKLQIDGGFPFTPVSSDDANILIGNLASNTQYITHTVVLVDRSAPDGTFSVHVTVSQDGQASSTYELPIQLTTDDNSLSITSAITNPSELSPGDRGSIVINVTNVEQSLLRGITTSLTLDSSVLVPVDGTNQLRLDSIDGGKQATFSFPVIVQPDAASSVYTVPVTLSYTTTNGTTISQQQSIGVIVRAAPQLSVIVDTADVSKDTDGTVLLRLVNKGLSQIKFTQITLEPGSGYDIASNAAAIYVGNINTDDFETAEFAIKPTADSFNLNLNVQYSDALNKEYNETVHLPIMTQTAQGKGMSPLSIVLLIVVVLGGFFFWRRSRAKKR